MTILGDLFGDPLPPSPGATCRRAERELPGAGDVGAVLDEARVPAVLPPPSDEVGGEVVVTPTLPAGDVVDVVGAGALDVLESVPVLFGLCPPLDVFVPVRLGLEVLGAAPHVDVGVLPDVETVVARTWDGEKVGGDRLAPKVHASVLPGAGQIDSAPSVL